MKKLIVAALFIPCMASAEAWSIPNKNGGEIVITDRECRYGGKSYAPLKQAYSHWSGGYLEGCWHLEDEMIKILWKNSDGTSDTRLYRIQDFTQKSGAQKGNGAGV